MDVLVNGMRDVRKLDFGCGDGSPAAPELESWLMENDGYGTVGIDVDGLRIQKARKKVSSKTLFVQCDGKHLPFPVGYFDVVHVNGVLHHIEGYKDALREIARVSSQGALLEVYETVEDNRFYSLLRHLAKRWDGDGIRSYFKSGELVEEISRYYKVLKAEYLWRSVVCDALAMVRKEGLKSKKFNLEVSRVLNNLGLAKKLCCHVHILAVRGLEVAVDTSGIMVKNNKRQEVS